MPWKISGAGTAGTEQSNCSRRPVGGVGVCAVRPRASHSEAATGRLPTPNRREVFRAG
jgi:hypothetical protein